jgi:hypothetical protein
VRERERNRKKQKQKTGHTHIRVYFLHLECLEERGKKKGMRVNRQSVSNMKK